MFFELVKEMLCAEGIESISAISLKNCIIKKPYLLEKAGIDKGKGNAVIFTVPYYLPGEKDRNISLYAVSKDYHLYFSELFGKILPKLKEQYPSNAFALFSDHSPIDEVHAASAAGLGIIGKNHLLITEKYSSFVFIGSIMTDVCFDTFFSPPKECENCGRCYASCPCHLDTSKCISALSQKKGELSEEEKNVLEKRIEIYLYMQFQKIIISIFRSFSEKSCRSLKSNIQAMLLRFFPTILPLTRFMRQVPQGLA